MAKDEKWIEKKLTEWGKGLNSGDPDTLYADLSDLPDPQDVEAYERNLGRKVAALPRGAVYEEADWFRKGFPDEKSYKEIYGEVPDDELREGLRIETQEKLKELDRKHWQKGASRQVLEAEREAHSEHMDFVEQLYGRVRAENVDVSPSILAAAIREANADLKLQGRSPEIARFSEEGMAEYVELIKFAVDDLTGGLKPMRAVAPEPDYANRTGWTSAGEQYRAPSPQGNEGKEGSLTSDLNEIQRKLGLW